VAEPTCGAAGSGQNGSVPRVLAKTTNQGVM
jgi:hypothetical protein